eukprot:m.64615 g.64615  ORF g.64615 m.64615 type:complete len:141 (-) comp13603_c0_seq3:1192-1614(-)
MAPVFLDKLYDMTHAAEAYVVWDSTNTKFRVPDVQLFARDVLPRFWKTNSYASFVRQLNLYGKLKPHHAIATLPALGTVGYPHHRRIPRHACTWHGWTPSHHPPTQPHPPHLLPPCFMPPSPTNLRFPENDRQQRPRGDG